jgi:hypothetical protein
MRLPCTVALHLFIFSQEKVWIISRRSVLMRKIKFGILLVFAVLALVSVASAALPAQVTVTLAFPGPDSYFNVDVTDGGNFDLPNANGYLGWCADSKINGQDGVPTAAYTPYDSRGTLLPPIHTVDWNRVNYIINHKNGASKGAIQQAVWNFDNGRITGSSTWTNDAPYLESEVQALIADANANGETYVPENPGELYSVILWKSRTAQPLFIEVPIPEIPVPEFPTFGLPVAMLIGVIGAVLFVRERKE